MIERILLFFITSSLFLASCKDVPCKDTNCANAGIITYDQGNCYCSCPLSTRGDDCEINLMDSVAGMYSIADTCISGISNYSETMTRVDSNVFSVLSIGNAPTPYDHCPVRIEILAEKALIDSQYLCNNSNINDAYLIYGKGLINYDLFSLKIDYYITHLMGSSNQIDTCRVFLKK
jgi:hypothetical protein